MLVVHNELFEIFTNFKPPPFSLGLHLQKNEFRSGILNDLAELSRYHFHLEKKNMNKILPFANYLDLCNCHR